MRAPRRAHRPSPAPLDAHLSHSDDKAFRTSQSADLCHLNSPVALNIDAKICKTLGIRVEYSEGIQAQRYDVGQQFKPHWDYFEPDTDVYRRLGGRARQSHLDIHGLSERRLEGGATRFTKIDHAVTAQGRHGGALEQSQRRTAHPTSSPCTVASR